MAKPAIHIVLEAALTGAESWPVSRRVFLYRQLAEICGDPLEASRFMQAASTLESADKQCREFAFAFTQDGGAR